MYSTKLLVPLVLATTALSKCGDYDGCPLTETCTTVTRTTTTETCMPTPTCVGVYCKPTHSTFYPGSMLTNIQRAVYPAPDLSAAHLTAQRINVGRPIRSGLTAPKTMVCARTTKDAVMGISVLGGFAGEVYSLCSSGRVTEGGRSMLISNSFSRPFPATNHSKRHK